MWWRSDGDPGNVLRLRENSSRNHMTDRLQVVHAAVWSYSASNGILFRCGGAHGGVDADGVHPLLGAGELINAPVISLDDFICRDGPPPQLIKIDVEGGEYEVLRGGAKLFSSQRPLVIAEIHAPQPVAQISAWLKDYRYNACWKIPEEEFPRHLLAWPAERDLAAWRA